jgi:hypothetical protein
MVANPFFRLKIACLKATVHTEHNHQCRTWFSRSGGFCYDSASTSLAVANSPTYYCELRQHHSSGVKLGSSPKRQDSECKHFVQWLPDHWQITSIAAWYAKGWIWIRSRVVAKSTGSGQPVFYIDGCIILRTVSLRRAIFIQKKWFVTNSLGLF